MLILTEREGSRLVRCFAVEIGVRGSGFGVRGSGSGVRGVYECLIGTKRSPL
jgi:hypothetical protein